MPDTRRFPQGFAWGVATSAYQIEGAVDADGRGPSIWDTFSHTPGRTADGDTGDVAVDHYRRFRDDVAMMADVGVRAYRFSLSWPRILPEGTGRVEQRGLDFYAQLVDELRSHGIEPWLTLYHWDLPQALQDGGGWPERRTADAFAEYAEVVVGALGDRVTHWSTLNEPWCSSLLSHQAGVHAPGEQDADRAVRALHHLLLAHGLAAGRLRVAGVSSLGITLNLAPYEAAGDTDADLDAARRMDGQMNRVFLDPVLLGRYPQDVVEDLAAAGTALPVEDGDLETIAAPLDWLGVNYYYSHRVVAVPGAPQVAPAEPGRGRSPFVGCDDVRVLDPEGPTTAMGWNIDPAGLTSLLRRLHDEYPRLPLAITENGAAYDDVVAPDGGVHDEARRDYLHRHLAAIEDAIAAGVDVSGYFAWSLMDNFEWAEGYRKRFGIVHVDYGTMQRTVKDSGRWYGEVARTGALPPLPE